jgi:hypothetical protein
MKALKKRDHQLLNHLKVLLQPIMDQINRKYRKFRQPVISQTQIDYLFVESDPNFVRPDVEEGQQRPFEIVQDKHGNGVLRETATGKIYYNLETTTIEERLSNGYYARPKDFLFDIKSLAKDAKNIGDKERTLKANELLSNVEVDVASIENGNSSVDWEGLYRRQLQRAKDAAEKERKRKALQTIVDRVQSDVTGSGTGGNDSDSGPVTLGEPVPGSRTTARFEVRNLPKADEPTGQEPHLSNGTSQPTTSVDVEMSGVDEESQQPSSASNMGPPDRSQARSTAATGLTQVSQKSAVTSLPPGVSPSAVVNDASTTKTSDPSTNRSSNWSTQLTNGNHDDRRASVGEDADLEIPDTAPLPSHPSQVTSSDEVWVHSQAQALRANAANDSLLSGSTASSQSQPLNRTPVGAKAHSIDIGNLLNDSPGDEAGYAGNSGSSASQPLGIDSAVESFLDSMTDKTSGCTIEQLEQINRDVMDEIWRSRNEWNRQKVLNRVTNVFNQAIGDIEFLQGMGPLSQRQNLDV